MGLSLRFWPVQSRLASPPGQLETPVARAPEVEFAQCPAQWQSAAPAARRRHHWHTSTASHGASGWLSGRVMLAQWARAGRASPRPPAAPSVPPDGGRQPGAARPPRPCRTRDPGPRPRRAANGPESPGTAHPRHRGATANDLGGEVPLSEAGDPWGWGWGVCAPLAHHGCFACLEVYMTGGEEAGPFR